MRVLIVKNDGIGDLILSSGVLSFLAKQFDTLDLVTCIQNKEIAESIEGINKRIYISRDSLVLNKNFEEFEDTDKMAIKDLQKIEYDIAIILRRYIRQSSIKIMTYIKTKKKYCAWEYPTNLSNFAVESLSKGYIRFKTDKMIFSELEYYKYFIEFILNKAVTYEEITPKLMFEDSFDAEKLPVNNSKKIGLIIGGNSAKWDKFKWNDLMKYLTSKNETVYVFGGNDVKEIVEFLEIDNKNMINLVGKLSFKDSIPILNTLKIVIGNDTGFMHFASLYVEKCLIILGGGTFKHFFPWPNVTNQYVIYYGMSCFDCNWECRFEERYCLNNVTSNDVISYLNDVINGTDINMFNINNKSKDINYKLSWRNNPIPKILKLD